MLLLLCALIRRLSVPNFLVALPYLRNWNTLLLGALLFWFRFTLCTTIILIPQSLAIRGFEASQIGPAIIWSAVPLIPVALLLDFCCCANLIHACYWPRASLVQPSLPG
jgi:MFS transporter, DHA2 family, multidrug resistance protein